MCELDLVFRALADRQRRRILSCLGEHHVVSLPDLAELVTELEAGEDLTAVSGERVRDVYFSLYHTHVPALEAADLVRYEQEDDLVVQTDSTRSALCRVRESVDGLLRAD